MKNVNSERTSLALVPVYFYCDLARVEARVIPLGVSAEIVVGDLWGLGILARTCLREDEQRLLGEVGRELLHNPYEYLCSVVEEAWQDAHPGGALAYLTAKHCHSFHFEDPRSKSVPRRLLMSDLWSFAGKKEIKNFVCDEMEDEWLGLLPEDSLAAYPQRDVENIVEIAAAA